MPSELDEILTELCDRGADLSGYSRNALKRRLAAGYADHLSKPLDSARLKSVMEQWMG